MPVYQVSVDGQDITTLLDGRLIDMTLTDNRGFEADQLDLRLNDSDGLLDLPPRGALIRVAFGFAHTGLVDKGSYTVDEVEHTGAPDILCIRARSADLRAGLTTQRERSWHDTTLGEIVRTIAGENDLKPVISETLDALSIDHVDQTNETAANLLTRLATQFDAIATVKNGCLLFIHAARGTSATGKALPAIEITRRDGDMHRFAIADRETYTGVRANWYNIGQATKGEVIWGKDEDSGERKIPPSASSTATTGQTRTLAKTYKSRAAAQTAARKEWRAMQKNPAARADFVGATAKYDDRNLGASGEVSYGRTDDEKARRNAGKRAERDAKAAQARNEGPLVSIDHSAENIKTLRHVYASRESARRAARAEWRRLQRGLATFALTLAIGRPDVIPETPASVSGWKPSIDNTDWIIARAIHTLSDGGLITSLELEIKATEIPD